MGWGGRLLQSSLLTFSSCTLPHSKVKACVTTGFLSRVQTQHMLSLPCSFLAHVQHHMASVFVHFSLSSLCSVGPMRLRFSPAALPQVTESPQPRSPQPLTQLVSHIGAKKGQALCPQRVAVRGMRGVLYPLGATQPVFLATANSWVP